MQKTEASSKWLIIILSVALPVIVGALYLAPKPDIEGNWLKSIPTFNAIVNGSVTLLLIAGRIAIARNDRNLHKKIMITACILSVVFLLAYVLYHSTTASTPYGGEGAIRYVYFTILLSHILLAASLAPLVLITLVRGLKERFDKHRRIARITFPIWLYVSITGVIVYLMIAPYYQ